MGSKLGKRAVRRIRRNALFASALVALILVIILALRLAPHNDDAPVLRVPTAADG